MTPGMTCAPEAGIAWRALFVGGPGRSGTSFVADRLGAHPQIVALKDIELKIFCEKNGLLDLFHSLVETYSPNRAVMALDHFRRMTEALIEGRYGQPALSARAPAATWRAAFSEFTDGLVADGHPVPQEADAVLGRARALLWRIAAIAADADGAGLAPPGGRPSSRIFLEKTPHNLLAIGFLARIAPGASFLHVMRDPRSIAWSLVRMRWGPSDLAGAARWVASYCRAWTGAEAQAAHLGLPVLRAHIEDIARQPQDAAARLCADLGLDPIPGLFRGADPVMLNRWVAAAPAADRTLLDTALGSWAAHFGYEPGRIGSRTVEPAAGGGAALPPTGLSAEGGTPREPAFPATA